MKETKTNPSVGIILLAAGSASRMGMPKQLLVYQQEPLILHVLDKLLALNLPVTVVLGARAALIRPVLNDYPVQIVENPDWDKGMGGSMQAGLQSHLDKEAVLLCVVDQPFLNAEILQALLGILNTTPHPREVLGCAQYADGTLGVPALLGEKWFDTMLKLPPQAGARKILRSNQEQLATILFPQGDFDLDKPEDWEKFRRLTD